MTVKRFDISGEHYEVFCDNNGEYVLFDDYAALKQKLVAVTEQRDALAVDNWNLRDVMRQIIAARPGGVYFNKWEPVIFKALNELPATEAAIATLRAEGVEIARNALIAFVEDEVGPNENVPGLIRGAELCVSIARQLRESKGADHE